MYNLSDGVILYRSCNFIAKFEICFDVLFLGLIDTYRLKTMLILIYSRI